MHTINLGQYIDQLASWITLVIGQMQTIIFVIHGFTFSLFDMFTYSAAFLIFVKIFIRHWVPGFDFSVSPAHADIHIDGEPSLDLNDIDQLINRF